ESKWGGQTKEICGPKHGSAFALYDQDLHFWKTCQVSFLQDISERYSESFPKSGMMQNGVCYLLQMLGLLTKESGCGHLPTPQSRDFRSGQAKRVNRKGYQNNLNDYVKMFPTPTAHNAKEGAYPAEYTRKTPTLASVAGGQLNPNWVEWLMGWPVGWTDLKPLEMDRFQQWLEQHGKF
ncbi:MAG: hypothetical protein WAP54_09315, partial [Bacteroidales bacterium]